VAYTLKGRLDSRLAAALGPLVAACLLALAIHRWWPVELAVLMLAVGVVLDAAVYDRLLRYQPGWLALPLGLLELGTVMGLARAFTVVAPLGAALAFYGGSWLLAQVLGHAVFPLARLSYGDEGGELGRVGAGVAVAALAVVASAGGVAWASQPPTIHLSAGVHQGPLVLDEEQILEGEPGAVVRGGIVVRADGVTVRDVTVAGGRYGITIEHAERVVLDDVHVLGAELDGINVRRSQVTIRDCSVESLQNSYGQGIDVSFSADLEPSVIEGCEISGGQEGIFADSVSVHVRDNSVRETTLRGITVTEMAMAMIESNDVSNGLGIGIFCSDYSECEIHDNSIADIRRDENSSDTMRQGFAIVSHYGAHADVESNDVVRSPGGVKSFADAHITRE
jgi:hypothetical protein